MKEYFKKFTSRKFLLALISVISGIMTMANCDDSLIKLVCSLIMIILPAIAYIITEGVLDKTSIGLALQQVIETINDYFDLKENEEVVLRSSSSIKGLIASYLMLPAFLLIYFIVFKL